ncbi:hypothetical protein PUS82_00220 [Cytobacillus firmus]|uniref:hypothetical protein n=1 Tax=Cytobacillus firmus TaxID=1399 RepID=UPI00237A490F|nr:hypothetical protein [Cytobacillus firmus]MDD9309756.1 hypothetical protein [Cytobacillus firmus]
MNQRTKYTIEWMQHNYKVQLLEAFESETKIIVSDKIEKNVPEYFLAECIASLANKVRSGKERNVSEAAAVFTYEENNLDIVFAYLNGDKPSLFIMEQEEAIKML